MYGNNKVGALSGTFQHKMLPLWNFRDAVSDNSDRSDHTDDNRIVFR